MLSRFQPRQETQFQTERQVALETLRSLTSRVNSTLDPAEVIDRLLFGCQELANCDRVTFLLVEKSQLVSATIRSKQKVKPLHQMRDQKLDDFPWLVNLLHSGVPLAVPDIRLDDRFHDYEDTRIRSWLGMPLVDKHGQPVAAIVLEYYDIHPVSEDALQLLRTFISDAFVTLQNAWKYANLERLAGLDELTGAYNRREFYVQAQRELERAKRYGRTTSVLLLDVDSFKAINDRYGHAIGDDVLREIIQRCHQQLRTVDVIARYGGDEFVILLPETGPVAAQRVAGRVQWNVEHKAFLSRAGALNVSISVGVATVYPDETNVNAALQRADDAMYDTRRLKRCQTRMI